MARGLAIVIALIVFGFGVYLLVMGQQVTSVQEVPENFPGPPVESVHYVPYPLALLYLVAAVPVLIGLIKPELMYFSWMGLVFLFLVSLMLLFSSGAPVVPAAMVLLILLAMMHWLQRNSESAY